MASTTPITTIRSEDEEAQHEDIPDVESSLKASLLRKAEISHGKLPGIRRIPLPAIGIILLIAIVNLAVWVGVAIVLRFHTALVSTAVLSYTLGLRHALDADHISAIDLMTRRLIATGQRPVTVGTFFSLGHSTIVIITSIVVAATAAAVSEKFNAFGTVGGIIGSSVSAAFLIILGIMNMYILYRLVMQMKKVLALREGEEEEGWKVEGGGCLFQVLKTMFKLIDRPWKMYPLGVLFGLGFDTSSEIALLGISSIQATKGTSIWVILIFPLLFTAGMCLIDTLDGALMLTLYILPSGTTTKSNHPNISHQDSSSPTTIRAQSLPTSSPTTISDTQVHHRAKDPITFLYYSIVLTALTVVVAIVIGVLQLLNMISAVAEPEGKFWDGVEVAGEYYDVIGGAICGSFVVVGLVSVAVHGRWRRRYVDEPRERMRRVRGLQGMDHDLDRDGDDGEGDGVEEVEVGDLMDIVGVDVEEGNTRGKGAEDGKGEVRIAVKSKSGERSKVDDVDDRV